MGTSERGVLYLEDPPLQTSTFSICRLMLGALLPGEGSRAWEMRMLRRAVDSFPRLLSHARAKSAPSLLATGGKKQLSKLCATPVGRQQRVRATSPSSASLHGVYIPSQSLLTTCPSTYRCYRHCKIFRRDWFDKPLLLFANFSSQIHLGQLAMGCPISRAPQSWVSLVCLHTIG